MQQKLKQLTSQLLALSVASDNPKLLFEEIQVIQDKAFAVQDELMTLLEVMEAETQDITQLQNVFQIRENIWDIMNKLADREREIKMTKDKKAPAKKSASKASECTCGCHHHHETCCHHEHSGSDCCHAHGKKRCQRKGKTCKKS